MIFCCQHSLFRRLCALFSLLIFMVSPCFADNAPIQVEADHMTSTEKTNSVTFTGDVDAKQADVRIRSDKMVVHYRENKTKQSSSKEVEKLVCTGNVELTRAEWLGTSKKMIYLAKERQVILTGNAKAWQGQNMVSGEKIIYYLDEGRSEVIGGPRVTGAEQQDKDKKGSRVNMTILQN
ncbi:lipopolysaccharide export system protein LptA [Desulforhopalus singaporensis]|uniref:Lipopolysaccharide export system protein LptA n=2 Tax=Desulforhopalus singaporensis TaxID=91360 RepID=A0A1H0TTI0_9BACT|nr:lipopolysaccharide export system protein LptA [Desulforhopalus singaporensis]